MQFQVPQFIETEDKIVGPLSLKQFGYLFGSGIVTTILYFWVETAIWILLSAIVIMIAIALGFVPIQGRPLPKVLVSLFYYYWRPQKYVWSPDGENISKQEHLSRAAGPGSGLENVVLGLFLRNSWKDMQTGSVPSSTPKKTPTMKAEHYEIFRRITGERHAARRIDYR